MRLKLLIIFALICIAIVPQASSCGCGLAISDMRTFNALKETQAYLLIDIHDNQSYTETPFFRMISLEESHNVTIVFPIDQIPYDVKGEVMSAGDFLSKKDILRADAIATEQDPKSVVIRTGDYVAEGSLPAFMFSNGIFGTMLTIARKNFAGVGSALTDSMTKGGAIAHFDFEGGSLDIYNVSSAKTLDELVQSMNVSLGDEVTKLVDKYKNYFVAVLTINVQSVMSEQTRKELEACPEDLARVKQALSEKSEFTYMEIGDMTQGNCQSQLVELVRSVTFTSDQVNGTAVEMHFNGTSSFFYPTSLVQSYKYPITDEKYFIKTPKNLDISFQTSFAQKKATVGTDRWYKVTSSEEDIKGTIIHAGVGSHVGDIVRQVSRFIYKYVVGWLVFALFLAILIIPFIHYARKSTEILQIYHKIIFIAVTIVGGLFIAAIVALCFKKWKYALTSFAVWALYLCIVIISKMGILN